MTLESALTLAIADRGEWEKFKRMPPQLSTLLLRVVLPLSFLPPVTLYYAGTYHGDKFVNGFGAKHWLAIAIVLLLAEWMTIAGMGRAIKAIARANGVQCPFRDAYLLAMLLPIPLWLSSLVLLVPSLELAVGGSMVALALSSRLIYHGVRTLCSVKEELVAVSITHGVLAVNLIAWVLLFGLIIPV